MINQTAASKKLSWLLRHCREPLYIELDGAWADSEKIRAVLAKRFPGFSRDQLEQIVEQDLKGRYSFDGSGRKIRANYGHSIPGVVIRMESPEPPEVLYHGTSYGALGRILHEGLKPMSRQYVHISSDVETALAVGARHGKPVILEIRARAFASDGHELFRAAPRTWLAREVPPEYIVYSGIEAV